MDKRTLNNHKQFPKILPSIPAFSLAKRGRLPKPLHQIGGPNVRMTPLTQVANGYSVWFMWKDGETLVQTAFYGYLFKHVGNSDLYPVCHFHWHPSHKPLHIKTPCNSDLNYTNRSLPAAQELILKGSGKLYDPRIDHDRSQLIEIFCRACGVEFGSKTLI